MFNANTHGNMELNNLKLQEISNDIHNRRLANYRHRTNKRKSTGQQILLERQGTMWEGSAQKELPAWMTQPEEKDHQPVPVRRNSLVRASRLLTALFSISS